MSLLDAGDDRGSALRLYESYERRLAAEFNSKPTAESAALAARIRGGERRARAREAQAPPPAAPLVAPPVEPPVAPPAAPSTQEDSHAPNSDKRRLAGTSQTQHTRSSLGAGTRRGGAFWPRSPDETLMVSITLRRRPAHTRARQLVRESHGRSTIRVARAQWPKTGWRRGCCARSSWTSSIRAPRSVQGHAANGACDRSAHHRAPHGCLASRVGQLLSHRRHDPLPGRRSWTCPRGESYAPSVRSARA